MLKNAGLPAMDAETEKLRDYQAAFEYSKKSQAELTQMIQAKEKEMLGCPADQLAAWKRGVLSRGTTQVDRFRPEYF